MENIEAMLCAYIEGDLDEAGRKEIEKHLADHPQHRKLLEDLVKQRDLLRQLPRVTAPGDVGEGLRGQMERSILLDSKDSMQLPHPAAGFRWPQFITAAAILLLGMSLVLIVYRTVVPTFKPATYTQVSPGSTAGNKTPSDIEADIEASRAQDQSGAPLAQALQAHSNLPATQPAAAEVAMAAPVQSVIAKPLAIGGAVPAGPTNLDWDQIRRQLKSSGYDTSRQSAGKNPPILLVATAPDTASLGQQVSQFLSSQNGISWWSVPENSPLPSPPPPATEPTTRQSAWKSTTQPVDRQQLVASVMAAISRPHPATEPSVRIYVACGLTTQQATALQQTLSNQPADAAATVQVTQQSPMLLDGDEYAMHDSFVAAGPATQPSTQPAATMPSAISASALADAIIIIQPAGATIAPPAPSPTPIVAPATRPAIPSAKQPTTSPSTH